MTVWIYNNKEIRAGKSWTDKNGIQHPANWHIWSTEEKTAMGISSVEPESPPDSNYYTWSMDSNYKITKSARPLAGVKVEKIEDAKSYANTNLSSSDWYVTRKAEADTAIPSGITALRTALRTNYAALKSAINAAGDVDAVAALYSWTAGASIEAKEFNGKTAVNPSTNAITISGHGFVDNELVNYSVMESSSAVDGLTDNESYYIINKTTNTFKLSHSHSNCGDAAAISLTATTEGDQQSIMSQGIPPAGHSWPDSSKSFYSA